MNETHRITIDDVAYVREDSVSAPGTNGNRAVVVVDRGWIFAGDVSDEGDYITLGRAVWMFRWERIGFAAAVADPTQDAVDVRKMPTQVQVPKASVVFRLPVSDDWGL